MAALPATADPAGRSESFKLTTPGAFEDGFGAAVAFGDGILAVGAPGDDEAGVGAGAFYLYCDPPGGDLSSETRAIKVVPDDLEPADGLGQTLAVDGRVAVAGGQEMICIVRDVSSAGDWSRRQASRLTLATADREQGFGRAVAVAAGLIVVGAPLATFRGERSGSAFIYSPTPASPGQTRYSVSRMQPEESSAGDRFGAAVAAAPGVMAVGAPFARAGGEMAGSVTLFVFDDGDWRRPRKVEVTPARPAAFATFGRHLGLSGSTLLVASRGGVHLFRDISAEGDWTELSETLLVASDRELEPGFATAAAIHDRLMIVAVGGALRHSGATYLYRDTSRAGDWSSFFELRLIDDDRRPFDGFGSAVALTAGVAAVGAPWRRDASHPPAVAVWDRRLPGDGFESGDMSAWGSGVGGRTAPAGGGRGQR